MLDVRRKVEGTVLLRQRKGQDENTNRGLVFEKMEHLDELLRQEKSACVQGRFCWGKGGSCQLAPIFSKNMGRAIKSV